MFTLEGFYEAILEVCHAFLALNGAKTISHECAIEFLRENGLLKSSDVEFLLFSESHTVTPVKRTEREHL